MFINRRSSKNLINDKVKNGILELKKVYNNKKDEKENNGNCTLRSKSSNNLSINNVKEENDDKLIWLRHLTTPKILYLRKNNKLTAYIFKLVPTDYCFTYGVEHYNLEYVNISDEKDVFIFNVRMEQLIYYTLENAL
jgi:hypothetical protein